MDDAALLELPDDPILLKRLIIERDQTIAHHAATLKERDESIQLLSQDNQLLRHRLAALLRSSYGPRAERFDPRQLLASNRFFRPARVIFSPLRLRSFS